MNLKKYYRYLIGKPNISRSEVEANMAKYEKDPTIKAYQDNMDRLVNSLLQDLSNTVNILVSQERAGTDIYRALKQKLSSDDLVHTLVSVMLKQIERAKSEFDGVGISKKIPPLFAELVIFYLFTVVYSFTKTMAFYDKDICDTLLKIVGKETYEDCKDMLPYNITEDKFFQDFYRLCDERFSVYGSLMDNDIALNFDRLKVNPRAIHPVKALGKEYLKECFLDCSTEIENSNILHLGIVILSCHLANIHDWQECGREAYPWSNCPTDTPQKMAKIKLFD
jgi:hypothetical protein